MHLTYSKYPITVIFCIIWSIIGALLIYLGIEGILRIIIGLPIIFFIPGYVVLYALFPTKKIKKGIDNVERIALSLGLSIAIVPLIGIILNYTPWGIKLEPILISLEILIIAVGSIAILRWYHTPPSKRYNLKIDISIPKHETKFDKVLTIVLVILMIVAVTFFIYVVLIPKPDEKITAFYLLGPTAEVADYPLDLSIGENASVIIGIENHESRTINYTVEIWLVNQTLNYNASTNQNETIYHHMWLMDKFNVTLDHVPLNVEEWQPQWEYKYNFNITRKGHFKLAFLLYTAPTESYSKEKDYKTIAEQKTDNELTNSYKNVYIWLNVQ